MTKQVLLRLPDELSADLDTRLERVGLSRNEWIVRAIRWALDQPIRTVTETKKM